MLGVISGTQRLVSGNIGSVESTSPGIFGLSEGVHSGFR